MGRRKWKLYQDALIPRAEERSSDDSMPATEQPPALKIKTIEQINEDERKTEDVSPKPRQETILESLIKRPATQPKVELAEEPADWKPPDKCYFCTDGERPEGEREQAQRGATSPATESDSSSVSGAKSPAAAAPPLLQHLLQLQSPQTIAQFQQMIAALTALGTGLVPPPFAQNVWMMPRMVQNARPQCDSRVPEDKAAPPSPSLTEQPLDLSAKSTSSASGTPPPDAKSLDQRLKRAILDGAGNSSKRNYTEDELQSALRDIQSGRLGTRRAAVVYGIPRSTLRNKVNKFGLNTDQHDSEPDSDVEGTDSPPSVILKIPTFPPPDDKSSSPATSVSTPITPITPMLPNPQPQLNPASQLLLPPSVFADPPSTLFTSISDVIAKSISQKFQQPLDRPQPDQMSYMRAQDRHVSVIKTPPENMRNQYQGPSNSRAQPNNNGQPAGGKGTRPKRGKYRNYDRDSLVEAVKAVQRGEMSVHRAGSYYGVPHSTLEYKVKERHLMRPRKREPKPQPEVKPQPPKPPPPKPTTKPFSNGLNGPDGYPGYPFWAGANFNPHPPQDLYASHMMQRLRAEAPPANGSFLEGIIRSSLERPGAALLQRLNEPRGMGESPSLVRRLTGEGEGGEEPPARRARIASTDRQLAAEMREAVQRLRADKLRPRNGTPTPPAPHSPPPAPPDRA